MKSIFRKAIAAGGLASMLAFSTAKSEVLSNFAVSDDFNNDGKKDLLVLVYQQHDYNDECPGETYEAYTGYVSIRDKEGELSSPNLQTHLIFCSEPEEIAVRDVNGDGNKDLIFTFYDLDDNNEDFKLKKHIYLGDGRGNFKFSKIIELPDYR